MKLEGQDALLVVAWNAWLTALFALVAFPPLNLGGVFATLLVCSWVATTLVSLRTGLRFQDVLERYFPDVAAEVGSLRPLWHHPWAMRTLASLALVKAVRTDPDVGACARSFAWAYWYPVALIIAFTPVFASVWGR